jgi:hypothetical protein
MRAERRAGAQLRSTAMPATAGILLVLLLSAVLPRPTFARKDYRAESYNVLLRLSGDGSVSVREEIRVRFDGGPFTFFYRGIPFARTDGIDGITPSDSARVRMRNDRADVTWQFAPCRDTTRVFTLEYRARGVLYEEGGKRRFRWRAFPQERAYPIDAASALVLVPGQGWPKVEVRAEPGNVSFVANPGLSGPTAEQGFTAAKTGVRLAPTALRPNRSVVLQVDMASNLISGPDPGWHQQRLRWKERLPGPLAAAAALLVLGILWILRARADVLARLAPGTAAAHVGKVRMPVSAPPEEVSPALAGALVFGQPALLHAVAVLLDLARRGALRIDPGAPHSRWTSPRPRIRRGAAPADLEAWERIVLDSVFAQPSPDGSVEWRKAISTMNRRFKEYRSAVHAGLVRRGAFDAAGLEGRRTLRRRLLLLIVPDLAAAAAGILLLGALGPAAFLPLGAMCVVMTTAAVVSETFPLRTRQGADLAHAWKGFARYLKDAARGETPIDAARFAAWLPLALSLGVATQWTKAAQRRGIEPPDWFRSDAGDMAADMRVLASVVAATISSSGGSASGGAAGGGSSGAG